MRERERSDEGIRVHAGGRKVSLPWEYIYLCCSGLIAYCWDSFPSVAKIPSISKSQKGVGKGETVQGREGLRYPAVFRGEFLLSLRLLVDFRRVHFPMPPLHPRVLLLIR